MPLALPGTNELIYNNPATWTSWAPHATDGFYVSPATNHYHCLHFYFYIPATQRFCLSDTWCLYPSHCQVPTTLKHNMALLTAANLLQQLGCAIPTTTTAKLKHLNAICQLTIVMSGQLNVPPLDPTSPRVVPATPLRVAIAAPLRVARTSNTITAPNTFGQSPIIHQRLTRHNTPSRSSRMMKTTMIPTRLLPEIAVHKRHILHSAHKQSKQQANPLPLCPPPFRGHLHHVRKQSYCQASHCAHFLL
jgi:hypothetical protein